LQALALSPPRPRPQVALRQSRCDVPIHPVVRRQKRKHAEHSADAVSSGSKGRLTIRCVQKTQCPASSSVFAVNIRNSPKANSPTLNGQAIHTASKDPRYYCTVSLVTPSFSNPPSSTIAAQKRMHSEQMYTSSYPVGDLNSGPAALAGLWQKEHSASFVSMLILSVSSASRCGESFTYAIPSLRHPERNR
jgi:hypothetical protein